MCIMTTKETYISKYYIDIDICAFKYKKMYKYF